MSNWVVYLIGILFGMIGIVIAIETNIITGWIITTGGIALILKSVGSLDS